MRLIFPSSIGKTSMPSHSSVFPFARRRRSPFVDDEAFVHVEAAAAEADVGVVAEDLRDVLAHRVGALGTLTRGVVVEDDVVRVHRRDRVEVVRVPRVVVPLDQLAARSSSRGPS